MKAKLIVMKFFIFFTFSKSYTKQDSIGIVDIANLGTQKISLRRNHKIIRFNCTPYFEGDSRDAYLVFTEKWNVLGDLYIFYDVSKINRNSEIKSVGSGYDTKISLLNIGKLHLSLKQNIGYFVFADFYSDIDSFTIQYFHMNSYFNISDKNNYYFSFPASGFYFTFSYRKNEQKLKNLLSFEVNSGHTAKTTLYNKNKTVLKEIDKLYGGFSFIDYDDIDEFFIKIQINSGGGFTISFLMEDYPNLFYLSQKNNTIKFDLTIYSSYIYCIDIANIPENKINFLSKWSSMYNTYLYYYSTNITNVEELKSEFLYRFEKKDRIVDGATYVSYDKFTIPIKIPGKKIVFIMYPKKKDTDYYIKAIFYSSHEIYTNTNYDFELDGNKGYYIFNYKQKKFFNNSLNGFIFSFLNNSDDDCSLYIYNDLNDIYLDDIKNKDGNLKEKNWRSFDYLSGEIYFLIANFRLYYSKKYSFLIKNNNEYYDISNALKKYSSYSFSMKFNDTQNQYLTFTITPHYNYYIFFDNIPSNLIVSISTLTSENKTIIPIDNKYYFLNYTDTINFKIIFSSKNYFSEFNIDVKKIENLPTTTDELQYYLTIGTVILGAIQILMFIIFVAVLKCIKNKEKGIMAPNLIIN